MSRLLSFLGAILCLSAIGTVSTRAEDLSSIIAHGEYIARQGDCMACHTTNEKHAYGGGLAIKSPFGDMYSTNISPDPINGIGNYSEEEFSAAVRDGVRRDGARLYPAMPYPSYVKMSDADIHALYVYIMKGVQPVSEPAPVTSLGFPFNQRWGMFFWNMVFTDGGKFEPDNAKSDELNRGAYLVQAAGHCGSCHTPRAITMQEKAYADDDDDYLAGGELNGWAVPALRAGGDGKTGIATWTNADIVQYLQTGRNQHASVGGEMTSVIEHSMSHMTDADTQAIAAYLKSLPGIEVPANSNTSDAVNQTAQQLTAADHLSAGQRVYLDNCTACHVVTGKGAPPVFPTLAGSELVNAENPNGLIEIILNGARLPSTPKAPTRLTMPDFGWRLNDQQIADLATFVRGGWGNRAGAVSASDVRQVRSDLPKPVIPSKPRDEDGVEAYAGK